jgi:chromosomal replication initiator protein
VLKGVENICFPAPATPTNGVDPLDGFLAGPENRLVIAAVRGMFDHTLGPVPAWSPLVLIGPAGVGKSHLARGLAAEYQRQHPEACVCQSAAEFGQDYAQAHRTRSVVAFRQRNRSAEMLVIEDVHRLARKPATQQELVRTLDALADRSSQAVVTSRRLPRDVPGLCPALVSRLEGGLQVTLSIPGPATRLAILQRAAQQREIAVAPATLKILADGLEASVLELLGALTSLAAEHGQRGTPVDASTMRQYLLRSARPAALRNIALRTSGYFKLKLADLKSPSRSRNLVLARDVAIYLSRQLTGKSFQCIGAYYGGRDHSTVMHSYRKADELAKTDPAVRLAVAELRQQLCSP